MNRPSRVGLRFAIAIVLLGGSAFAWREYAHRQPVLDLPSAPVHQGDFNVLIRCRGALTARRTAQITAPIGVTDLQIVWLAPAGGEVKEGQSIIRFDESKLQQDLREKNVALQQAQATFDQAVAQAQMRAEQDKVDLSSARYAMEKARLEVSKQTIVSAMEGQKSALDLKMAEEKVTLQASASDLHNKSDEAKNASQRRLRDEAQAEVSRVQSRLRLMDMKSPFNGVINYLTNYSQGWMNAQPFKVGDHVSAGAPIAEIPDLSTLEMESKVEETDRGRMAVGNAVLVHVDAFPENVLSAHLVSVSPLTEQSFDEWPPTRSFRAFAKFDKPDARLRPSMNAAADIIESTIPRAISIPARALFTRAGSPIVYLKQERTFVATSVKLLARNTDEVAISGIPGGSTIALTDPELQKK